MREIKFRAYHKKEKRFYYFDLETVTQTVCVGYYHPMTGEKDCELDDYNLYSGKQFYTGLKDSEVVEEYFGDIIEEDDGTRRVIEDEVSFVAFRIIGGKGIKYFWELLPHTVIGNIYENLELLKGQDYRPAKKRHCSKCGWEGLENETGFGHNDFYCPICLIESLDIRKIDNG